MKAKTSVSLMIAVVLGLVTAKVGTDLLKKQGGGRSVRVVVAKADFDAGHVMAAADLQMREVQTDLVPETAFKDPKDVIGRTAIAPVAGGQFIFEGLLAAPGSAGGLQALVPPGMRAVTVDVSESSGLAGQLVPGCRVDVIATLRKGDSTIARTIVENVKVSAVNRSRSGTSSDSAGPARTVTLIVKPKEAAALELANSNGGKPRLILRGNADSTSGEAAVSQNELLGMPDAPAAQPEPQAAKAEDPFDNAPADSGSSGRPVQIIKGGTESTIYMNDENGASSGQQARQKQPPQSKTPSGEDRRKLSDTSSDTSPRTDASPIWKGMRGQLCRLG